MKERRISLRHLLLAAVTVLVLSAVGHADPLTITITGGGVNTFVFQNPSDTMTADDFTVILLSDPPPSIGGGFGGPRFPNTAFGAPAEGGGFTGIAYFGPPGVPPGGRYTHSFPDWPVDTTFAIFFSYRISPGVVLFLDPIPLGMDPSQGEGETRPVPEPTALLLLGTGLAGVAIKTRKRFKTRKSG